MAFDLASHLLDLFRIGLFAGHLLHPVNQRSSERKMLLGI
jgi:hypothetical protein